jgi:phage gp36-like protein
MAVDVSAEMTTRYGSRFLREVTNFDPNVTTVDTARLDAAIKDAKSRLYRHTGRKFEYVGIEAEYLDWQVNSVINLAVWILEGYALGQTIEADSRYEKWVADVERERDRNEIPDPATNATVTSLDPNPPVGEVFPVFNDSDMDDYVPGGSDPEAGRDV